MDENEVLDALEQFLAAANKVDAIWNTAYDEIGTTEGEILDILHELEFMPINAFEGYQRSQEIKIARQKRRAAKNAKEILYPLREYLKNNQKMLTDLWKVTREMKRAKENQATKVYGPRVRQDLKICKRTKNLTIAQAS